MRMLCFPQMSRSCLVPLVESVTTGAIAADDSDLNIIDNISFKCNQVHATLFLDSL